MNQRIWALADKKATPFYLYDEDVINHNYSQLRSTLPERMQILYSVKANPHPRIVRQLSKLGAGMDVGSKYELELALQQGVPAQKISFVGPGKTTVDLIAAVNANILCVVAESLQEILALEKIATEAKTEVRICVRVNPRSHINNEGQIVNSQPSQFGIDEDQLPAVLHLSLRSVKIIGLHFYLGSQFVDSGTLIANFTAVMKLTVGFQSALGRTLQIVNLGGGFGIPYFSAATLDLEELKHGVVDIVSPQLKDAQILVESGRFLVGSCGIFVTQVLYRKISHGRTYLICDGGFAQHLAAASFGLVVRKNLPISLLSRKKNTGQHERVCIAGPSCYHIDLLAEDLELPAAEAGDLLCIAQSGCYGPTFSPQDFLSPKIADEFFVHEEDR